jgi:predicted nucleic acid-binding protein
MPATKAFLDTNVLLYLLSGDAKADKAETLLAAGGTVSVQVLNEFASTASRKLKMKWPEIREILGTVRSLCEVVPVTVEIHEKGIDLAQRYGVAFYDSLILAAADASGCRVVFSEDMQHSQRFNEVTVRNPF